MSATTALVNDLMAYAAAHGGRAPTRWHVRPDDYRQIIEDVRKVRLASGRPMLDGCGVPVDPSFLPPSVLVMGVRVEPSPKLVEREIRDAASLRLGRIVSMAIFAAALVVAWAGWVSR